jgi:hypothetical protein
MRVAERNWKLFLLKLVQANLGAANSSHRAHIKILVTGRGGLQDCDMLRISYCINSLLTSGGKVVCLTHRPRSTTQKHFSASGTHFWPSLWSSGQSSWLRIHRSEFYSRRYQIFWKVMGLERGPLCLVSTTEELFGRKSSCSGLTKTENTAVRIRHADQVAPSIRKWWH